MTTFSHFLLDHDEDFQPKWLYCIANYSNYSCIYSLDDVSLTVRMNLWSAVLIHYFERSVTGRIVYGQISTPFFSFFSRRDRIELRHETGMSELQSMEEIMWKVADLRVSFLLNQAINGRPWWSVWSITLYSKATPIKQSTRSDTACRQSNNQPLLRAQNIPHGNQLINQSTNQSNDCLNV